MWGRAGIELTNPGSAFGLATNCATGPGFFNNDYWKFLFHEIWEQKKCVCVCVWGGGGGGGKGVRGLLCYTICTSSYYSGMNINTPGLHEMHHLK